MKSTAANKLRDSWWSGSQRWRSPCSRGHRLAVVVLYLMMCQPFVTITKGEHDAEVGAPPPAAEWEGEGRRILSRRRRFLVFPEDSSLQLLFDEVIPIVDYTLLITTGETVALAWQLPSKPINFEDVLLPARDADSNIAADAIDDDIGTTSLSRHDQKFQPRPQPQYATSNQRLRDSYYFDNSTGWRKYLTAADAGGEWSAGGDGDGQWPHRSDSYYYDTFAARPVAQQSTAAAASTQGSTGTASTKELVINPNFPFNKKRPIVALPLGKRSIADEGDEDATAELFRQHHRTSRYELYSLIDRYLGAHGQNGAECVLKTLCEVGQRPADAERGSFMVEILRAIFSLPDSKTGTHPHNVQHYHKATKHTGECARIFSGCPHSIWSASFIL